MNLKEIDYKLIEYLFHNASAPVSKIAKNTKLSRDQVNYRISKYLEEGIITKFATIFNNNKLGYDYTVAIFLKFQKKLSEKEAKNKTHEGKNCQSWGRVYGNYDMYMTAIFKTQKELNSYLTSLMDNKENPLSSYLVIDPYFNELYPLKFIGGKTGESYLAVGHSDIKYKPDKTDLRILKTLEENGRSKIVDIAEKAGISAELALHRLKKLRKEKVILGSRVVFDIEKLGYYYTAVTFHIPNFSEEKQDKIKKFVKNSSFISSLIFTLHKPNCLINIVHKNEKELRKIIENMRDIIDEPAEIETIPLGHEEDEKINTLPYLEEL